jgi:hypothetical protein
MATATGVRREVRNQLAAGQSQEEVHQQFLRLCQPGAIEADFLKAVKLNSKILEEKDENGNGLLFQAAKRGFSLVVHNIFVFHKDFIADQKHTQEVLKVLKEFLIQGKQDAANDIYRCVPSIISKRDAEGDTCLLWACRECLKALPRSEEREAFLQAVKWCFSHPLNIDDHQHPDTGETPFSLACREGFLVLAKIIHNRRPNLDKTSPDASGHTPLLKALRAPQNVPIVIWLLYDAKVPIRTREEIQVLAEISHRFADRSLKGVYSRSSPYLFVPYGYQLRRVLSSQEEDRLSALIRGLPHTVVYRSPENARATQSEEIVQYYDLTVKDVPDVQNPYTSLTRLYSELTEGDFLGNMNLGKRSDLSTLEEAKQEKERSLELLRNLLEAVKARKPDYSIPKGKEELYYRHLERILKHLAQFLTLKKEEDRHFQAECFSYLAMLKEASGYCYSNYATVLHKVYSSLKGDVEFTRAWSSEDIGWRKFIEEFRQFYRQEVTNLATRYCQRGDAHAVSVVQRMFDEEGIHYEIEKVHYASDHLIPALLNLRTEILNKTDNEDMNYALPVDAYSNTKELFLRQFNREVAGIKSIYQRVEKFLLMNLSKERSGDFLADLNEWLDLEMETPGGYELKKVEPSSLLEYEVKPVRGMAVASGGVAIARGKYTLKPEGLYHLLKKLGDMFAGEIDLHRPLPI